jgi:TonB-dependent receptor
MKKFTLILIGVFCASIFVFGQQKQITLNIKNVTVKEALEALKKTGGYSYWFDAKDLNVSQKVSINVVNKTIDEVLVLLFKGQNVQYKIKDGHIVISKSVEKEMPIQKKNELKKISGVVLDEKGLPVIGASVLIPGTTIGVATDINGRFTMEAPSNAKLRISYIGYEAKEELLNASSDLKIKLEPTPQALTEIVITAQAIGQKNAILQQINSNTIKNVVAADRLQENPDANSVEALGRLPGISVQRSGGEGVGLVIRGLDPRYSSVTLNGVQLPSTSGSDRGTNLSGISQYALQGAEVYKSLTADLDANSVAGTVNLKLRAAPNDLHLNLMAQKGYNNLNDYWGNYKLLGEFSNRFFGKKLGVLITANAESVNRSTQTMGAGYGIQSGGAEGDILLNNISLNDISSIITRRSLLLSLDFKVSEGTNLMLYGMYSNSGNLRKSQSKGYSTTGAGYVGYNFNYTPDDQTNMYQTSLSGESKFKFLNIKADYGIAYSKGIHNNLNNRGWGFQFDNASTSAITGIEQRKLDPAEILPLFTDTPDRIIDCWLTGMTRSDSRTNDENLTSYLNFTVPFKIGEIIKGNVKFGGMYREKNRIRDDQVGLQSINQNAPSKQIFADSLDWVIRNSGGQVSATGISTDNNLEFLGGRYNFGNQFNFDRLNELSDTWERTSDYYLAQGESVFKPIFGSQFFIGYSQDVGNSLLNDQDINEKYYAGYLMPEINFGKYMMFLPGVRFENTRTVMHGFYATPVQYPPNILEPLNGKETSSVRSDTYMLPMIHLRIKPTKSFFMHFAYTQTLSRPDFNAISPNYYVNMNFGNTYVANNPQLKAERWSNFDAQFTFHDNKLGLFSVTAFYKKVKDKIWHRSYKRIKSDPIIEPFAANAVVDVSVWENHAYAASVNGVEFDWQSSFSYLPGFFKYMTLSANYTYAQSKTTYPLTQIVTKVPPEGGRPVSMRIDSTATGRMYNQPEHIANVSLGFNKNGFNAWFSFQYNGGILTGKNFNGIPRLDQEKNYFYRYDLQVTQKFAIGKLKGFEVLLNLANLSNFMETQKLSGDPRLSYAESYGWTGDLGLRFKF